MTGGSGPAAKYERQVERDEHVSRWFEDVGLGPGDRVLEIGSGPGHISLLAAERVGPEGRVYATDRDPDALRYLVGVAAGEGAENVDPAVTDASALAVRPSGPAVALLTYVLHHADDPPAILAELAGALAPESRLFVCEYHPDAEGAVGPPIDRRFAPERVRGWIEDARFAVEKRTAYDNESYGFVARR